MTAVMNAEADTQRKTADFLTADEKRAMLGLPPRVVTDGGGA